MTNEKPSIYYILLSRKFWMAAIGLILVIITTWGQDPYPADAVVTAIMGVVGAYIAGVAIEDGMTKQAEANAQKTTVITPAANVQVTASDTGTPSASPRGPAPMRQPDGSGHAP